MKKNIMSMNRTQSLNNVPSDAARRQQTHQQTQSPMIHQDYQIRDSNKNSSSNDRRRRRLSSSDNIRLSASERLRIRCGDGLFHPPTTTTTAASDKLTTTDGGRSHSNNLSKKQSKIELLGSRSNSNNKSAKLFKIMSNTNCISNDECVVAELGLSDRGDDNYEGDVAVAADKSSSNNGDELLIMASSSNTQNNHHSPHSSSNPASSRRRKRVVNARRSLSLNDAYYYDVDYFNDLDFAYDNDDGGNSDDGDGRVKEGIVEEESIEGTCSENDGEVDEKSGRMAQCERVAVNDEEGKQQQHCRVGATVRDGVRVGRDDNKRRGVKEEEEQQGGGGIVARIARQRATSTFTNNKQSVNEQQRQQQQQPKNDGSELLLDRSVSTTGSDVVAADVAAAATRSSTPPLKSHRRSLSFDDAHHYNNFGGLDDDLHSDSSLSMIGDGEFKDVTSGPTTSTSPPQHHTNSLTSSLEVVVGGPRVPKKRKDDKAAAPRSTKQQEGDEVDEDDAKMGKQQQTTLRLDAPNNKNNRERKLSVPSTAATSRTSDFTVPLADGEVDHDDEDDDESYSDVERMYDILTTNEAQQQKRREEQQQQQRRQERQMHQLDTSTLSHDTLLTHNRHSFMEDYIQLKMQNAELRSELQHSQAETSRLNSEVLNVQKENAELRMQNELLLASGGGREGTLKKENEFMKQILYNLERLGKIDNVDEILKSRSEDLGEEMDVVRRSNSAAATVGGNRRLFLRKRDSSRSKNKWGDELDWGSSCASVTNAPPPPVPQQRHRSMFRRFSAPFSSSKDNLMEVQELPITKSDECILPPKDNSQPSRMRRRSRSFSHHSLTSLFRWSQDEEQEISSVGATRSNLQQGDSEKSRSNSIGDAIKGISRSLSSKNLRGSISSTAKADANEPKTVQDDKDNSIPKVVHTNRGFDWMKCSDLSQDVVPSSQIPTLGGTSDSLPVGNDLNFNVDIREAARQASESYYRPTRNRGMRDKRLFGSSLMSSNSSGGFQN